MDGVSAVIVDWDREVVPVLSWAEWGWLHEEEGTEQSEFGSGFLTVSAKCRQNGRR
jgi:hypothetical protein